MITSPNRELLVRVATRLEPLLDELVFVGAQVAELLITDPVAEHVRPTTDVDAICEVASRADYFRLGERLKKLGFTEDLTEGAPICRWRAGDDVVDVMPTHEEILDFKGNWFPVVMRTAKPYIHGRKPPRGSCPIAPDPARRSRHPGSANDDRRSNSACTGGEHRSSIADRYPETIKRYKVTHALSLQREVGHRGVRSVSSWIT